MPALLMPALALALLATCGAEAPRTPGWPDDCTAADCCHATCAAPPTTCAELTANLAPGGCAASCPAADPKMVAAFKVGLGLAMGRKVMFLQAALSLLVWINPGAEQ